MTADATAALAAIAAKLDLIDQLSQEIRSELPKLVPPKLSLVTGRAGHDRLTMQEAAEELRVSVSMIKKLTSQHKRTDGESGLFSIPVGSRVFIPVESIREYLAAAEQSRPRRSRPGNTLRG